MTHEADFRADVERACDDARLSVTEIGSILIDEGHKWLALASGTPTRRAETTGSVGEADGGPVPKADAQ